MSAIILWNKLLQRNDFLGNVAKVRPKDVLVEHNLPWPLLHRDRFEEDITLPHSTEESCGW